MNYPKMLKKYREKVLLTQTELAEKLGVSFASVNRWENGHNETTIKVKRMIKELCDKNGITIDFN